MKNSIITKGSAYLQIAKMGAQITFVYRSNVIFQIIGVILQVYFLKIVWTAIYLHNRGNNHVQLPTLISYLTLINMQTWILTPTITDVLQDRVRTGDVVLDIAKPMSFPGQLIARQFGTSLSLIPFVILALPLAWLAGGLQLPSSVEALILYIISCLLAYCIVALIGLLMGLISFWTLELVGIQLIYRFVNQLFAGALIPLWLFPQPLHIVALFLPFQAIAYLPVSIYLGQVQGANIAGTFIIQVAWILILYVLVQLIWSRAQRSIISQGG